jgi:hypothetical protein
MAWEWWGCCNCGGVANNCVETPTPSDLYITFPSDWVADACSGAPANLGGSYTLGIESLAVEWQRDWTYGYPIPVKIHTCPCTGKDDAYIEIQFHLYCYTGPKTCSQKLEVKLYSYAASVYSLSVNWTYSAAILGCQARWTLDYDTQFMGTVCLSSPNRWLYSLSDYASALTVTADP